MGMLPTLITILCTGPERIGSCKIMLTSSLLQGQRDPDAFFLTNSSVLVAALLASNQPPEWSVSRATREVATFGLEYGYLFR
jgi:hypothetical protein